MQCNMAVALFFSYALLLTGPFAASASNMCSVFGALKYCSYLASFAWMNCIAGDTWWTLRPTSFHPKDSTDSSTWKFALLAWGLPILTAAIILSLDFIHLPSRYQPGFGGATCWFTEWTAGFFYLFIPVAVGIVTNTGFFVLTSLSMHTASRNASQIRSTVQNRNSCLIYFRLFCLMGVGWVFLLMTAWIKSDVAWICFIAVNTSQCIYLLVVFLLPMKIAEKTCCSCLRKSKIQSKFNCNHVLNKSNVYLHTNTIDLPYISRMKNIALLKMLKDPKYIGSLSSFRTKTYCTRCGWPVNSPHKVKGQVTRKNVSLWWRHHEVTRQQYCRFAFKMSDQLRNSNNNLKPPHLFFTETIFRIP